MRGRTVLFFVFAVVSAWAQSANPWATIPRPPRTQPTHYSASSPSAAFDVAAERQFLDLTNQSRVGAGLAPLQLDESLTRAARRHSAQMVAQKQLSHDLPGEPALLERLDSPNLHPHAVGENVGYAPSVSECHRGLMNSLHHRENILDRDFNLVGFGVVHSGNEVWVTEDFAADRPRAVHPH